MDIDRAIQHVSARLEKLERCYVCVRLNVVAAGDK